MAEQTLRRAADGMAEAIRQARSDLGLVACDNACDDAPCRLLQALADWEHQLTLPLPMPGYHGGSVLTDEDIQWARDEAVRLRRARLA